MVTISSLFRACIFSLFSKKYQLETFFFPSLTGKPRGSRQHTAAAAGVRQRAPRHLQLLPGAAGRPCLPRPLAASPVLSLPSPTPSPADRAGPALTTSGASRYPSSSASQARRRRGRSLHPGEGSIPPGLSQCARRPCAGGRREARLPNCLPCGNSSRVWGKRAHQSPAVCPRGNKSILGGKKQP